MDIRLQDGTSLVIRPIRPSDKGLLADGLARLSEQTIQRRFLAPKPAFSRAELRYLTEVDGHNHVALVALPAAVPDRIAAVGRFVRLAEDAAAAEVAIVVADPYQRRGLGKRLGLMLADAAKERGIQRFTASMLGDNVAAHRLMDAISGRVSDSRFRSGVQELVLDLAA